MKRILLRGILAVTLLLLLVSAGDYCSLRFQIPNGRSQFGDVTVQTLYAIRQKNGKTEYETGEPQIIRCVHSLFPHFDCNPCWYVRRHADKRVEI